MERVSKGTLLGVAVFSILLGMNVWFASVLVRSHVPTLTLAFLDVGQGDAIFIEGPTGTQVLIDGGPDRSVLRALPRALKATDRSIDLMIVTHSHKDHLAGLVDVLERYEISAFMHPDMPKDIPVYEHLVARLSEEEGLATYIARAGMRIHLGAGAYADVLYPNDDVSHLADPNEGSVSVRVVYGETSFMLTGDLSSRVEDVLIRQHSKDTLRSDVLKAGHHGSKYSTSDDWLRAVVPEVVVVSAGKDNTYGHPAPEMIARVEKAGARMRSTIDSGTIVFKSDGSSVTEKSPSLFSFAL